MNKPLTIICQAGFDIQFALSLYEKAEDKNTVSIYVVGYDSGYQFLKELNLKCKLLEFVEHPIAIRLKKPLSFVHAWLRYRQNRRQLRNIYGGIVYYFGSTDLTVASMVAFLSRKNEIRESVVQSAVVTEKKNRSLKEVLWLRLNSWTSGVHLAVMQMDNSESWSSFYMFRPGAYPVVEDLIQLDHSLFKKYAYSISEDSSEKTVLYIDSQEESWLSCSDFRERISEVIKFLIKEGFCIHVKPHPRLGYSSVFNEYDVRLLPSHVPVQFINTEDYGVILGCVSTSLTELCLRHDRVASVAMFLNWTNPGDKDYCMKLLIENKVNEGSGRNVMMMKNLNELIGWIRK